MPITKSAKKALRQNKKRRVLNLRYKNRIKKLAKELKGPGDLPQFYKAVDKAAKKGVLKKNTAARRKSQLAKLAHKSSTPK